MKNKRIHCDLWIPSMKSLQHGTIYLKLLTLVYDHDIMMSKSSLSHLHENIQNCKYHNLFTYKHKQQNVWPWPYQ